MNIENIELSHGAHLSAEEGACIMEVVSCIAGEPWSDHPSCACPIIANFLRRWNDDLNDIDRQILKPLIHKVVNSRSTAEIEKHRNQIISDWYFKVHAATWLEMDGLTEYANDARAKGAKANWAAARSAAGDAARSAAGDAARAAARSAAGDAARDAAVAAAGAAAGVAARAAAGVAARVAAGVAAGVAAWDAAWAAARDAAWDAARDAARDAAVAALRPNVVKLQQSALAMINECLDLTEAK